MGTPNPHRDSRRGLARFYLAFCTERFTSDLVWPAAAGNVFWSALTLAIDYDVRKEAGAQWKARLALLVALSGYLTFTWQRERAVLKKAATTADDRTTPKKDTVKFWAFDHAHIFCLVVVALMAGTGAPLPWVWGWLVALFGVTTLGHALGVWELHRDAVIAKAAANGLGVILAVFVLPPEWEWGPFAAALTVLGLWGGIVADEHRKEPYLTDRDARRERQRQAEESRRQAAAKAAKEDAGQTGGETAVPRRPAE